MREQLTWGRTTRAEPAWAAALWGVFAGATCYRVARFLL